MDSKSAVLSVLPLADEAPTHPRDAGRFTKHADGRLERK